MLKVDELKDKLLTVDQVRERLTLTEGLVADAFCTDGSNTVNFTLPDEWGDTLREADPLEITEATVSVDGIEVALTKEALLEATSLVGITKDFVMKTPGALVQPLLNYWYSHGKKTMKLVRSEDTGLAFARGSVVMTPNLALLDEALTGLDKKYGGEIMADYKFHHDLHRTNIRLIVPEEQRQVHSMRAEEDGGDPWSFGLCLENSVIGEVPLSLQGYLFAWWCTNGSTTTHSASAKRRRPQNDEPLAAVDWVSGVVNDVLGELEHEFEAVAALPSLSLEGDVGDTAHAVFEKFAVPVDAREQVLKNLADSADLSAYGLMNAITAAANDLELPALKVNDLLRIGGEIPHALAEMCGTCHRL